MATISATSYSEFIQMIRISGAVVECPENAVWDVSQESARVGNLQIACSEIRGNGTKIIGASHSTSASSIFNFNGIGCLIDDLQMIEMSISFGDISDINSVFNHKSGNYPVVFKDSVFTGTIISNGHSDKNCFFHTGQYGQAHTFDTCAISFRTPSGGCIAIAETIFSGTGDDYLYNYQFCRLEITTTSENAYSYEKGYTPIAHVCVSGQGSYQFPPTVYASEVIIHAPNADYLELIKDVSDYPYDSEEGIIYDNCVLRGELANGAEIGKAHNDRYESGTRASVYVDTLGTLEESTRLMLNLPVSTVCNLDALTAANDAGEVYEPWRLKIGTGNDEWHTGDQTINAGFPYIPKMIDLPTIELLPVDQLPYITIHDILTPQAELEYANTNGLAILTPTSCEVTEELNGAWTFSMTHPIDPEGKWEKIKLRNLVKINGQYFTILNVVNVYENGSGYIQCSGEHIFYQQNDSWIFPGDPIVGVSGADYITKMNGRTETYGTELASLVYYFYGDSDITGTVSKETEDGCTPIDALIGSGGLIDQSGTGGAELYRDNFRYSINARMENAIDDAFDIRIGRDLSAITRNFDTSQFVSYFRAYGEAGWWAVAWKLTDFLSRSFPHHIIRSKNFDVPAGDNFWDLLISQGMAFFRRNGKPIVGWDITLEDVRNNPDFEIVMHDQNNPWRLKVGDSGSVYDERLGGKLTGLKISGTVYDAVRDKVIKITIGDQQHFSAPSASAVTVEPEIVAGEYWLRDADGKYLTGCDDKKIYAEVVSNA